jgi:hypothetical protein
MPVIILHSQKVIAAAFDDLLRHGSPRERGVAGDGRSVQGKAAQKLGNRVELSGGSDPTARAEDSQHGDHAVRRKGDYDRANGTGKDDTGAIVAPRGKRKPACHRVEFERGKFPHGFVEVLHGFPFLHGRWLLVGGCCEDSSMERGEPTPPLQFALKPEFLGFSFLQYRAQ